MSITAVIITLVSSFAALAAVNWLLPWLYSRVARIRLRRRTVGEGTLVLTFDDGPGRVLTPRILSALKRLDATAVFFLLGSRIAGNEELVREIAADGHQIASHGFAHLNHWTAWPAAAIRDIGQGWRAIDSALGLHDTKYPYRPPYGKLSLFTLLYLVCNRVPIHFWTIDSGDTRNMERRAPRQTAARVVNAGGGVLLLHDFDRDRGGAGEYVLQTLEETVRAARSRGLRIQPLGSARSSHCA